MKFVSVDVSTKFLAYALWEDGNLIGYGKLFPKGTHDAAIGSFAETVIAEFMRAGVQRVVYESAFLGKNVNVVKGLSKATGSMIGGFYACGVLDFVAVPPITWQTGIGVGRTKPAELEKLKKKFPRRSMTWIKNKDRENRKQLVIDLMNKRYGLKLTMDDNDVADAIGIGYHHMINSDEFDIRAEE